MLCTNATQLVTIFVVCFTHNKSPISHHGNVTMHIHAVWGWMNQVFIHSFIACVTKIPKVKWIKVIEKKDKSKKKCTSRECVVAFLRLYYIFISCMSLLFYIAYSVNEKGIFLTLCKLVNLEFLYSLVKPCCETHSVTSNKLVWKFHQSNKKESDNKKKLKSRYWINLLSPFMTSF